MLFSDDQILQSLQFVVNSQSLSIQVKDILDDCVTEYIGSILEELFTDESIPSSFQEEAETIANLDEVFESIIPEWSDFNASGSLLFLQQLRDTSKKPSTEIQALSTADQTDLKTGNATEVTDDSSEEEPQEQQQTETVELSADVKTLVELFPIASLNLLKKTYRQFGNNLSVTLEYLLSNDIETLELNAGKENSGNGTKTASALDQATKAKIVDRYLVHEEKADSVSRPVPIGLGGAKKSKGQPKEPAVRYLGSQVVSRKGEKRITLQEQEDPAMAGTYVKLATVYTKGKRYR